MLDYNGSQLVKLNFIDDNLFVFKTHTLVHLCVTLNSTLKGFHYSECYEAIDAHNIVNFDTQVMMFLLIGSPLTLFLDLHVVQIPCSKLTLHIIHKILSECIPTSVVNDSHIADIHVSATNNATCP